LLLAKNGQDLLARYASAIKANALTLLHNMGGAERVLASANEFMSRRKWIAPFYAGNLAISRSLFDLSRLEEARSVGSMQDDKELSARSRQSARAAVRCAAKYAANKTEALRLMGIHYWLCRKHGAALKWFAKSIETGAYAGARPELARTYAEVGKRLAEKNSGFPELNGMKAGEYLDRAEILFTEMGLAWDLKELAKVLDGGCK
jgi:hypothetical protein